MRFIIIPALIGASFFSARAADRVIVDPAQMLGQYNSDPGKLVFVGNQMVFVDDANPGNSFVIPRSDISAYNLANGVVTFTMAQPYALPVGSGSAMVFRVMNSNTPDDISAWIGMPPTPLGPPSRTVETGPPSANRMVETGPTSRIVETAPAPPDDYQYVVRFRDEDGRLIVGPYDLHFESVRHPDHSRTWSYRDIKEFKRDGDEIKMDPYHGDSVKIHIEGGRSMSDEVYNMIGDRIVDARRR